MVAARQILVSQIFLLPAADQKRYIDTCLTRCPAMPRHYIDGFRVCDTVRGDDRDSVQITNLLMLGVLCFKLPSLVESIVSTVTRNLIQLLREERAGALLVCHYPLRPAWQKSTIVAPLPSF